MPPRINIRWSLNKLYKVNSSDRWFQHKGQILNLLAKVLPK